MGWDSECSFLSAIPLFLGHKINLEFGCSGWEPEYSILGKEQFFLLKALDFEQRVPNFGTEARASYIFLSSLSSFSHTHHPHPLPPFRRSKRQFSYHSWKCTPNRCVRRCGVRNWQGYLNLPCSPEGPDPKSMSSGEILQSSILSPINSESRTTGQIPTF